MKGRPYQKVEDGEWVRPRRRGYRLACCDCGLVHRVDFRIVQRRTGRRIAGADLEFRAFRDSRATGAKRAANTKAKARS